MATSDDLCSELLAQLDATIARADAATERMAARFRRIAEAKASFDALPERVAVELQRGFEKAAAEAEFIRTYRRPS